MNEFSSDNQIGESEIFYTFQKNIRKAASVDRSVLLVGERGSGKEFAASRLHYLSSRWKNSFVKLNCAALTPSLIESELFGHEKGAYTGADRERRGRFEEADHGTLFLDEISLIPLEVQEKILRVVEYGTFERVGSSQTKEVDVRIIGAANQDLPSLCREGKFKQDLLDRLTFEVLFVPPLRSRADDIIVLSDHFAQKMGKELGIKGRISFSDTVISTLKNYSWPGNIRELKNTVERAVYRSDGNFVSEVVLDPFDNPYSIEITDDSEYSESLSENKSSEFIEHGSEEQFPDKITSESFVISLYQNLSNTLIRETGSIINTNAADFSEITDIVKKDIILYALKHADNNQKQAAGLLNLSYDQFRGIFRKYFT